MSTNKNVFASKSERENYYKLSRNWGDKYHIYHNLPFLNVLSPDNLVDVSDWNNFQPIVLTELELSRLKKTSIDYTLCDDHDQPILCIEFDGLQQGFNVGTTYYPGKLGQSHSSPWRRQITELKLRVAVGSLFPYFVVASEHFRNLPLETNLIIIDGIIGEVVASKQAHQKVSAFDVSELGMSEDEFERLTEMEKQEHLQDWVDGVEVIADMENNPIVRRRWELGKELGVGAYSVQPLFYPNFEPGDIDGFKSVILFGTKLVIQTDDFGDVSGEAWLPNFNVMDYSGIGLTQDIAMLIALERLKQMREQRERKKS